MAPEAPDPQSLKSWQDAFQYPIPTVRRVEQELRRDIASNKEKLRALVGTRYRELVGTAETIVAMNKEIQDVESILADVGRRCNPRLVEKKHQHARQMKNDAAQRDADKHAFGAQLALLHRCTAAIARLLRKRASLLLVAKILVVSRQLHNNLSKHETTPPFLEDLRKQLASLRHALLQRIDKRLVSNTATDDNIIESLAALCIVTNSSADDAIHRFHQLRSNVIANQLDLSLHNIPNALRLFIRSLQTSKTLRSRQFSDVLLKLKTRPILSDPEIRSLDGLEIDVLGRWAAPEVRNFTPWVKLTELGRTEGVDSIKEWSSQAFERFCEGCQKSLTQTNDFPGLLSLRADALELWLSSWGSTITHHSVDVLERLRSIFNENLKRVLTVKVQTSDEIASQVSSTVSSWETTEHTSVGSFWDSDLITADFSNGAIAFKQSVADRLLGRDDDVSQVLKNYQAWLLTIQEVKESIDSLRSSKWTDILVGGEMEDEDIDITPRLNEDDPEFLSESLHSAVRQGFDALQKSFSDAFQSLGTSHQTEKATFLLRLIRLVRRDIPAGFVTDDFMFSNNIVPGLQELLAAETVKHTGRLSLVPSSQAQNKTDKLRTVPGRTLWEGKPAVPVQPSPGTFKFLRRLTATMDENGSDLWDPSTVRALKQELQKQLEATLSSTLDEMGTWASASNTDKSHSKEDPSTQASEEKDNGVDTDNGKADAVSETNDTALTTEVLHDWKVQLFFDTVYLSNMLGDSTQLAGVVDRVQKSINPSPEAVKAIQKLAQDYWKRTELLFGLLAQR